MNSGYTWHPWACEYSVSIYTWASVPKHLELAYDGFRSCFYIFMNHRYGSKKVLVLTVIFVFVSKNSHTFHHYKQISLKWFDAHHHKLFLNVQKRKKFFTALLLFYAFENSFEVVCITHNGLHKVKQVMILIFLVFAKRFRTRLKKRKHSTTPVSCCKNWCTQSFLFIKNDWVHQYCNSWQRSYYISSSLEAKIKTAHLFSRSFHWPCKEYSTEHYMLHLIYRVFHSEMRVSKGLFHHQMLARNIIKGHQGLYLMRTFIKTWSQMLSKIWLFSFSI